MSDVHGAVGSYVVDALEAAERAEFEAHLAGCAICRVEVEELSEAAAELSALRATSPPASVRDDVLSAIRTVRPLPTPTSAEPAQVAEDQLAVRRLRRRSRILTALVAAVTLVAVLAGGWAYTLVRQQDAQVTVARLQAELLSAPDAKIFPVELKEGGRGSFVVARSLDRGAFVGDLPALDGDRRYQLWTVGPGQRPRPDLLLNGGGTSAVELRSPVADAVGLAISIEPGEGSTRPTDIQALTRI